MPIQKKSNGSILMKGNGSLMDDCCCVASCNPPLAASYSIVGYFDAMFDIACATAGASANPVWDGTFTNTFSPCNKTARAVFNVSIQGFLLQVINTKLDFFLGDRWTLIIDPGSGIAWRGEKFVGINPPGTYAKISGCAGGPATVTIV